MSKTNSGYNPFFRDDDVTFQLWRFLNHTAFVINRSRQKELARYGLTPEQAHVLDILHQSHGAATIQDIVKITLRQHHSISTLVGRMAAQGLVKKVRSASDARKYNVTITAKGRALYRTMTRDSIKEIFSCLSAGERAGLDKGLKKLMFKAFQALDKNNISGGLLNGS
jgi:DNA-binding MarR family transcriptional regulator